MTNLFYSYVYMVLWKTYVVLVTKKSSDKWFTQNRPHIINTFTASLWIYRT